MRAHLQRRTSLRPTTSWPSVSRTSRCDGSGGSQPASERRKKLALAAADLFCSPADNLQETFGLSVLEAMASSLPVVASDWNGYRDLVLHGRTGWLVPCRDLLQVQPQPDGWIAASASDCRTTTAPWDCAASASCSTTPPWSRP